MEGNDLPHIQLGKKNLYLYKMKNGVGITCHGKPKKGDLIKLHDDFNINYVLTILYPKERPETIQKHCNDISPDIHWENLPLFGANIQYFNQTQTIDLIISFIKGLLNYLEIHPDTNIFIHCAAGLHRTGTILYTILRCCGESKESVMDAIKAIRFETWRDMGAKRIDYAENTLVSPLLDFLSNKAQKNENS